jgi:ribosomal protein L15
LRAKRLRNGQFAERSPAVGSHARQEAAQKLIEAAGGKLISMYKLTT